MADDVIFDPEDRVKVISGKLKGNKGYVRYVGTVPSKKDAIYVGAELDEPNGKHNGIVNGKKYFKCRDKHGYMAPYDVFELFGKSKNKVKPAAKKRPTLDRKPSTKKVPIAAGGAVTDDSHDTSDVPPLPTDVPPLTHAYASNSNLLTMGSAQTVHESSNSTPVVTQITYRDAEVQTDIQLSLVENENDIAQVSKEVAEAHTQMIQSLRAQIGKLHEEIAHLKSAHLQTENEKGSLNDMIELLTIEKEAMSDEIESHKQRMEEQRVQIEHLELDLEELRDERDNVRRQYAHELEHGQQHVSDILEQNRVLSETMEMLKQSALQQVHEKNEQLASFVVRCSQIKSLEAHVGELQKQLGAKMDVENELAEFKREIDLRADSDAVIEVLSTKNVELEFEVKRLCEVNRHLDSMDTVYADMETENEQYIYELGEESRAKDVAIESYAQKMDKLSKELRDSRAQVQQFKDHIRKLEETKRRMSMREHSLSSNAKEQQLEKEMLLRSNLELVERVNLMKGEMINYCKIASSGLSDSVQHMVLQMHIPKQIKCDFGAMEFLGFLFRVAFKCRFCKEILDAFFIAAESMVGGDIANKNHMLHSADVKDTEKALEMIPILVKQDRFIEAIQRALIASFVDSFNEAVTHWSVLLSVEEKYDRLLAAVQAEDVRGKIAISDVFGANDVLRTFVVRYFADFNPEQKCRAKDKVDKWALYEVLQQLKYSLFMMQLKTQQINDVIAELDSKRHGDGETAATPPSPDAHKKKMMNGHHHDDEQDTHALTNGSFTPPKEGRQVEFGVLQKMEQLQGHLTQIVQNALKYCSPTRCSFFGRRSNLNYLQDANYIGIEHDFVERTAQMMRFLSGKLNNLLSSMSAIDSTTTLSRFECVGQINRLLDEQSESSPTGLVPSMEELFKHIQHIPYALEKLYTSNALSVDSPDHKNQMELDAIALGKVSPDKLYFMHCELQHEVDALKQKRLHSMIRTATTEHEKEQEDASMDTHTQLFGTKVTPWSEKATRIREELENADIIRDALESAQAEIKSKQKGLLLEKSKTQQIKSILEVVTLELAKQQTISKDLVHFELEAKESEHKLLDYIHKNKDLKQRAEKLMSSKQELETQVKSYQKTLSAYKQKSGRNTPKDIGLDDADDAPSGRPQFRASESGDKSYHDQLRRHNTVSGLSGLGSADKSHHRRGCSLGSSLMFGKNGTFAMDLASSYPDLDGGVTSASNMDDRVTIARLHKQLDMNKNYNALLEKTVNALRHSQNVFDMSKQWMSMKRELRPLSTFSSLTDAEYRQYMQRKKDYQVKKDLKLLQKQKRRERLLVKKRRKITEDFLEISTMDLEHLEPNNSKKTRKSTSIDAAEDGNGESEHEIDDDEEEIDDQSKREMDAEDDDDVKSDAEGLSEENDDKDSIDLSADDQTSKTKKRKKKAKTAIDETENESDAERKIDAEMARDQILSSYEQKQLRKERYDSLQRTIYSLESQFGSIYSCPQVVDLAIKHRQSDVTHNQTMIGRNLKLRDIKLKCQELAKECADIESNFVGHTQQSCEAHELHANTHPNESNLVALGRVEIPQNHRIQHDNPPKVCLNKQNVIKLQSYLNVLC